MKNEELIECLLKLKDEGISYKYIANACDIPTSSLYTYINTKRFPYFVREKISNYINNTFKGVFE